MIGKNFAGDSICIADLFKIEQSDTVVSQKFKMVTPTGDTVRLVISSKQDTIEFDAPEDSTFRFKQRISAPIPHGYMYFDSSAVTCTITVKNTYVTISNSAKNAWTVGEQSFMTIAGDTIIFLVGGDYKVHSSFSFSGTSGNDYKVRLAKNGVGLPGVVGQTCTGPTNYQNVGGIVYQPFIKGDRIKFQVANQSATNDAIIRNAFVFVEKIGE
jgi:hypothetical protein